MNNLILSEVDKNNEQKINPQIDVLKTVFKQPFDMQSLYTSHNPQITFLRSIYRRHTDTKIYTKKIFDFKEYEKNNKGVESDEEISFIIDKKPTQFISAIYVKIDDCEDFKEFIKNLVNFELYSGDNLLYSYDGEELELKLLDKDMKKYNETKMFPIFQIDTSKCLFSKEIRMVLEFRKQYENIQLYTNMLEPEMSEYRKFRSVTLEKIEERTTYSNILLKKDKEVKFKVPDFHATKIFIRTKQDNVNIEGSIVVKKSEEEEFVDDEYNNETEYPINKTVSIDLPQVYYDINLPKNTYLISGRLGKLNEQQPSGMLPLKNSTITLKANKDCDVRITMFFHDVLRSHDLTVPDNQKLKNGYDPFMVTSHNIPRPRLDSESKFIEYWVINEDKLKIYKEMDNDKTQVNDKLLEICRLLSLPKYEPDGTGTEQKRVSIQYILDKLTTAYKHISNGDNSQYDDVKKVLEELYDLINQKKSEEKILSDILTIITRQPETLIIKDDNKESELTKQFRKFWDFFEQNPYYEYLNTASIVVIYGTYFTLYLAGCYFINKEISKFI